MSGSSHSGNSVWIIGSSPDCEIRVDKPFVSGKHCRLRLHDNQFLLEDLGSTNGTFVNARRLEPNSPIQVSPQDQLTLGPQHPMPWPVLLQVAEKASQAGLLTIGRAPDCEIQLDYPMISWLHARITREGKQWIIEDLKSRNGTALNQIDNKIQRAALQPTDDIYLGSYKIAASRILTERRLAQGESAFERVRFQGDRMVLGRDPSCDYSLNFPEISWHHAALLRTAEGIYVEDLDSRNGTYINGARINGKVLIRPGQEIGLGSFRFQLLEDGALAKREYRGNVTIEVNSVAVNAPNGDKLLDSISLTIFPSELVALMGPAGSGKTTFLKAINGYTPPASGRVLFNGADLYQFYDRFRHQLSYVPQDDIVHPQLTVREALYFNARMRTDLTDTEIEQRIDSVLSSLEIRDKKNTVIGSPERKVLSGGQRKRVNIAMELIAAAPVIFLDEPTSGLSSYDAEKVIEVLKKLSSEGNTIITTIHQPSLEIFKKFDTLIMISRDKGGSGSLAYFGPAHPNSIEFFDPASALASSATGGKELIPEMLLSGLAKRTTAEWAATYEQSSYKNLFVHNRSGKITSATEQPAQSAVRKFGFGQWWTLVRRNILLKARDRAHAIILLVQSPLLAVLLGGVFQTLKFSTLADFSQRLMTHAVGIEFLMVVAAIWFGCNNAARDIVGEWTVFQRERMISLKLPSYVFSKLAVAAMLSLLQCLMLLGIVTLMCGLKADFLATFGILYMASLVGAALGLCISALASSTESAIAMLPLVLLPVIALGGGLTPINGMPLAMQQIAKAVPSRWAFEAALLLEAHKSHAQSISQETNPERQGCDLAEVEFPKAQPHCDLLLLSDSDYRRTPLAVSFAILTGMLLLGIGSVLAFLRMRDIQ
jgi:ABC transport system ATP-binding/permease protein